jgi:hypothetical protein
MMGIPDVPALARTVPDYCAARDRTLALVKLACESIDEAEQISKEHVPYSFPAVGRELDYESIRKKLDGRYWQFLLDRTGAAAIMDGQARKEFRDGLERGEVPEFTVDNVATHFLSMHQTAGAMFARGVYNLFRRYVRIGERGYETNRKQPFAIPRKLILDRWFSNGWGSVKFHVGYHATDEVNDFGRIVNVLAGRAYQPRGFEMELNAALKDSNLFENAIIKVRAFANGNAHLWIKDRILLDKLNEQLAFYCGDALAQAA